MRYQAAFGLFHARGGVPLGLLTIGTIVAVVIIPDIVIGVSIVPDKKARGVGSPEVFGLLLSSLIPYVSYPRFSGYELMAPWQARLLHLGITMGTFLIPVLVFTAWHAAIGRMYPGVVFDSFIGLLGVVLLSLAVSYMTLYVLGGVVSVIAGPASFILIVLSQHWWPDSIWATQLPTGKNWHTNWWLIAAAMCPVIWLSWRKRGLPGGPWD